MLTKHKRNKDTCLSKILNKNFTFRADRLLMLCNKLNIDISDFYHNVNELMKYENYHDKSFVIKFKYAINQNTKQKSTFQLKILECAFYLLTFQL